MESTQKPDVTIRVFYTRVSHVKECSYIRSVHMVEGKPVSEVVSLGWFLLLEGSQEQLFIGHEKPTDLSAGDEMEVTIRKRTHDTPNT